MARWANAVFVMATKGTSYGTVRIGNESLSASSTTEAGTFRKPKPIPNPRPAIPCLREPADVRSLRRRRLAHAEARREEELAALEPLRRVGEFRDVQPADLVLEPLGARRHLELELGQLSEVPHRQHVGPLDIRA